MGTVTAKQLHQETKSILDQLEQGEPLIITRNGQAVGRLEPLSRKQSLKWDEVMAEVWEAQGRIKSSARVPNPVLLERQRRRR
jgi:antitoxin (DNA-binding transcriptional repressor) of toxin-antitoxin stability system